MADCSHKRVEKKRSSHNILYFRITLEVYNISLCDPPVFDWESVDTKRERKRLLDVSLSTVNGRGKKLTGKGKEEKRKK